MEDPPVIDASTFANSYIALWQSLTPTCEHFVRWLNLNGLKRFEPPMAPSNTAKRRATIAEYAFSLFVEQKQQGMSDSMEENAWRATELRLRPYAVQGLDLSHSFDEEESREVDQIFKSLSRFFSESKGPLVLRPVYVGCGYIGASEGDVISGRTIYEVKTVERPFRSSDVRQTIAYAALNYASGQFDISNVGLFNPRRGQYCDFDLEQVAAEISGRPAQDLLATIIEAISSGEMSR
jgi:hypothetical protein